MDTIAAISTPSGVGGIAVVRLSGPEAFAIAAQHTAMPPEGREVRFALFRAGVTVLDEVVVTIFRAPHSYTGEDTVEIACHGSLYVQQTLLQALLATGARLAEPGEFTRRAFLNGRLDLSQAEAVADLIDSTNAASHRLAMSQLRGGYAQRLAALRQQFVELASLLELELDFSDEEVEFADRAQLLALLDAVEEECRRLCDSFRLGNAIKNGIPVAIVGRPNVGKSTLLNALVGEERAIVSDIAGTTRDTVEDTLNLDGITYRFIDTAGIRHSDDAIERQGIERSYRAVEQSQVVLYMVEAGQLPDASAELEELRSRTSLDGKQLIVLASKCDQYGQPPVAATADTAVPHIAISAKTGQGLDLLRQQLSSGRRLDTADTAPLVTNLRHCEALQNVLSATALVRDGLTRNLPADLVVIDLRDALHHLGTITGQVASDELLGTIFSRFCIGK